jgi:hypothetical protein
MSKLIAYPFEIRPLTTEEGGGFLISYPDFSDCPSDGPSQIGRRFVEYAGADVHRPGLGAQGRSCKGRPVAIKIDTDTREREEQRDASRQCSACAALWPTRMRMRAASRPSHSMPPEDRVASRRSKSVCSIHGMQLAIGIVIGGKVVTSLTRGADKSFDVPRQLEAEPSRRRSDD